MYKNMDTVISQESFEFIIAQLEADDRECSWQLASLPAHHKHEETDTYRYWKEKQAKIRKTIRELQGLTKPQ